MFKRILLLAMILVIIIPLTASAGVHFEIRGNGKLGGNGRSLLSWRVSSSSPTCNRGGSSSSSLPIYYLPVGNQDWSQASDGGYLVIRSNRLIVAPESDRNIMWINISIPSGWHQNHFTPRMRAYPKLGQDVRGFEISPNFRMNSEILTITIQYCDARQMPDGDPVPYEYTIDRVVR